jgi:predicted HTH transcriptional regulator
VSAFMNSSGGYLLIGVGDDKQILGLDRDLSLFKTPSCDVFAQHFTNIINNHLGRENRPYVTIRFNEIQGKKIAVVVVPKKAPNPVYTKVDGKEQFYIRLGNASHPLNVREAATYIRDNFFKRV